MDTNTFNKFRNSLNGKLDKLKLPISRSQS